MDIHETSPDCLDRWTGIPIRFDVKRRAIVTRLPGGWEFTETAVDPPYSHDYDALEPPTRWREWDLTCWGFLEAQEGPRKVGAAAIAFQTPGLDLLEGRADVSALWDIRVLPELRGAGIGHALFHAAARWARARGAASMRIETQDINVPACRFYERQGCRLEAVTPGAYPALPDQVQLLWRHSLQSA